MKNQNNSTEFFSLISKLLGAVALFIFCLYLMNHEEITSTMPPLKLIAGAVGIFFIVYFISYGIFSIILGITQSNSSNDDSEELPNTTSIDIRDGDVYYFYSDYHFGYSRVEKVSIINARDKQVESRFAFANEEGEIVTKWYDGATEFEEPGVAIVYDNGRYNFLDNECKPMLLSWPANVGSQISDDKLKIFWDDGTINFVDFKKKSLLWKDWKKSIG